MEKILSAGDNLKEMRPEDKIAEERKKESKVCAIF